MRNRNERPFCWVSMYHLSLLRGALLISFALVYTNRLYCGDNAGIFRTSGPVPSRFQRTVQYNRTTIGRCPMTAKSFRRGRWRECNLNSIRGRITPAGVQWSKASPPLPLLDTDSRKNSCVLSTCSLFPYNCGHLQSLWL